jgi:hypothetical protein
VQKWLDLIRGSYLASVDELKLGQDKRPCRFLILGFLNVLSHTLWFCRTWQVLSGDGKSSPQKQNSFYNDYAMWSSAPAQTPVSVRRAGPCLGGHGRSA